jgi:DNA (cytosine-5)-methyltransferase 1
MTGNSYQVRYGILLASHYGVPQGRRRVIFLAARRDVLLPDLPQPTHVALQAEYLNITPSEDEEYKFSISRRSQQAAPLGPVTITDAIGDLPEWEWYFKRFILFALTETILIGLTPTHYVELPSSKSKMKLNATKR